MLDSPDQAAAKKHCMRERPKLLVMAAASWTQDSSQLLDPPSAMAPTYLHTDKYPYS